ncbi:hypothetical protein HYALB_00013273 [Hymenoscyphus albidus]|uniref:Transcription factor BYE1 n=1 Tax=Hymenoscyphus albidus TaxID=595503 RepID=A0A9N9LTP6_9HELO|nr:hypothetical protein HYALB_00013273 [Hymenoscyphus albidus]
MADEPRRSVRATKGQHTKSLDLLDQPVEPKKKATKKAKKVEKKEDDAEASEVIRCVCGAVETGNDDTDPWIACDKCDVWQHNICVGFTRFEEDTPENYKCEQCDPTFPLHKELLDALKKGRKLWEERRKKADQLLAEEKQASKKKGGKKGKSNKRVSEASEISYATNGKAKSPSVPVPAAPVEKKETVSRAPSTKRKASEPSHENESEHQSKVRKVSASHTTPQQKSPPSDLPTKISELETSRQAIAKFLKDRMAANITNALHQGIYNLSPGDSAPSKTERLAIQIENAVLVTHPGDKTAYQNQCRAIAFNLKQNQELCNRLLTRTLNPTALATMSSDDMASKELKIKTAELKAQADIQSVMVEDDGPRVRRTHKGEEIVEDGSYTVPTENPMSSSTRRRSMLDPNADMGARSRENSPGNEVELPADIDTNHRSRDDIRGQVLPKQPLAVDTRPNHAPARKASGQADFDINKVFSSVQSPVTSQHVRRPSTNIAPPANGPGVDPEIDKLLQDDENDSPPYSPAEYSSDPDVVWRGTVTMDSVAKFSAAAKHVGGAHLKVPWTELLQKELKVAGRIDKDKANEYLCSLRYSPPTDVVVVSIAPTGDPSSPDFQDLYNYFYTKLRFGVLSNKGLVGNVRDTYLVPVAPGGPIPDFVINLDGHQVPLERTQPILLVALVVRSDWVPEPEPERSFQNAPETQSPSIMTHPQRQMTMSGAPPSMSPINPQNNTFVAPQVPQPPHAPQMNAEQKQQREGEATAARILGQHLYAPTVKFLMPQAYQMRPLEWEIIRDILEKDLKAQQDLQYLSQVLEIRMKAEGTQEASKA